MGLFVTKCQIGKHEFVAFGDFCGKLYKFCAFRAGVIGQTSNLLYLNTKQDTAEEWLDQNPALQYFSEEQQREAYENYLSS